ELAGVIQPRTSDSEPLVRAAAARALGLVRATDADTAFSRLLGDPDPRVRAAAAEGVAEAAWRGGTPALLGLLADTDRETRIAAAKALGVVGDEKAVPQLTRAFIDADRELGDAITLAIARIDRFALGAIIDLLLERDDVESRVRVVETLGGLKPPHPMRLLET